MSTLTIVGASTAGFALASALREFDYSDEIRLIGAEKQPPYNRTALTKTQFSDQLDFDRIALTNFDELKGMGIEFIGDTQAIGLDHNSKRVQAQTGSGSRLDFDYEPLVIATGIRARRLPQSSATGVFYLRDFHDVVEIQKASSQAVNVTVLGTGILGLEVASNLVAAGKEVTVVGRSFESITRVFGEHLTKQLVIELGEAGIDVKFTTNSSVHEAEGYIDLVLDSGERVSSEILICAIGSEPNSEWLDGSPLTLRNGLVVTSEGQAWDSIFAIGDVAIWGDDGSSYAFQNQANAIKQARSLAQALTGRKRESIYPGYFWSEVFGKKVQAVGQTTASSTEVLHKNHDRWVMLHKEIDAVVGISAFGMPREFARTRHQYSTEIELEGEKV